MSAKPGLNRNVLALMLGLAVLVYVEMPRSGPTSVCQRAPAMNGRAPRTARSENATRAAVAASSGVHGLVEKRGHLDPRAWHASHASWRGGLFLEWWAKSIMYPHADWRVVTARDGLRMSAPPLITDCLVYVNHALKIIYVRAPKTGSSSILDLFGQCGEGSKESTCMEYLKDVPLEDVPRIWREYFVVGFSRNPWRRAVGTYQFIHRAQVNSSECNLPFDWGDFCWDPLSIARFHTARPQCNAYATGQWDGHWDDKAVLLHVMPQSQCFHSQPYDLEDGKSFLVPEWSVDYIGRAEHSQDDMMELLELLHKRRAAAGDSAGANATAALLARTRGGVPRLRTSGCRNSTVPGTWEPADLHCEPEAYYAGRHADCFESVRHFYMDDVRLLQFPTHDERAG